MKYPSISLSGNILSPDILDRLSHGELPGQAPQDFGLDKGLLREEINSTFAMAKGQWDIFQARLAHPRKNESNTRITRTYWLRPLMGLLGFDLELHRKAADIQGKSYAISHRASNRGLFPLHLIAYDESLDRKIPGRTRMSPHAMLQEYLNLHEHLYALLSNGRTIRLLRDASRLVKLTYLEFDLERMMEDELTADFALMYRLLHVSRMPVQEDQGDTALIEAYHQEALMSGSRIRDGLSQSVEQSIEQLGQGFLDFPANDSLRRLITQGQLSPQDYYQQILRLIYRLLFLFVIEERGLVYPSSASVSDDPEQDLPPKALQDIYFQHYSLTRLRRLSEKRYLADQQHHDLWIALRQTFRLYRAAKYGAPLGIKPLGGILFGSAALEQLEAAQLDNATLLQVLKALNTFYDPKTQQYIRVNYAALNVEEFGSVYENLLEKQPQIQPDEHGQLKFKLIAGEERTSSGSHYTPDPLVKPLIQHSLDHLIEAKLKQASSTAPAQEAAPKPPDPREAALLSLRVCDVACGSGHILLAAARRIGLALAQVRTGEDQPNPHAQQQAIREVIRHCIYGVDKNPLAVELCKVALWLEAHNPGEPLNFLDHHIKCGDAIVGLARPEELLKGIPTEAFKSLPGDDKEVAASLRKRNKRERGTGELMSLYDHSEQKVQANTLAQKLQALTHMPEATPKEVAAKAKAYHQIFEGPMYLKLRTLADIQVAQFFIPKTQGTTPSHITDAQYRAFRTGHQSMIGSPAIAKATATGAQHRFFHWFLEFPDVFVWGGDRPVAESVQTDLFGQQPKRPLALDTQQVAPPSADSLGFDCILGNPPFLGGYRLTGTFGHGYYEYLKSKYTPAGGQSDLVTYFFRRIFELLSNEGFQSLISTNTIAQGDSREGGLAEILKQNGSINHAVRSMRWPGLAAVEVAMVTIYKGKWKKELILNQKTVEKISSYLDSAEFLGEPKKLKANKNLSFKGSMTLGKGFVLEPHEAQAFITRNPRNAEVIYPYLNGADLNGEPDGAPTRYVINFHDWPLRRYTEAEWTALSEEERHDILSRLEKGKSLILAPPDYAGKVAADYPDCLEKIERDVKAKRQEDNRKAYRDFWWQYAEKRGRLYRTIASLEQVLAINLHTKYCQFNQYSTKIVYSHGTGVFVFDYFLNGGILLSSFHGVWAWKHSSTMGASTLRYSPSRGSETFPFPVESSASGQAGQDYLLFRSDLFLSLQLGLTDTYNQFHNPQLIPTSGQPWGSRQEAIDLTDRLEGLDPPSVEQQYGKDTAKLVRHIASIQGTSFRPRDPHALLRGADSPYREEVAPVPAATLAEAIHGIWELRRLHVQLDEAVLTAYGWDRPQASSASPGSAPTYDQGITLEHVFQEVDYLPENDRIRFTISPAARKEVLRRLLLLNHARYAQEQQAAAQITRKKPKSSPLEGTNLFNPGT